MDSDQLKYNFVKLVAITSFFLNATGLNAFQPNRIKGRLLSLDDKTPISYASVLNITSKKQGTTTTEDGRFALELDNIPLDHKIYFSCLGYQDTTIVLSELMNKNITLYLKERTYALTDYVVSAGGERQEKIGDETIPVQSEISGGSVASPGYAHGVYVEPKRRKDVGVLESLKVYVTGEFYNTPFYLRVLQPQKQGQIQDIKLYDISNFVDLLEEQMLHVPDKRGWYEIDLSSFNIPITKEGLFILFVQLDKGDKLYRTQNGKGEELLSKERVPNRLYGHELAFQNQRKGNIFTAIYTGTSLGIIEKDNSHLAVVVNYIH